MSKIWHDTGQLLTLTTNISGTHRDINKQKMVLSTAILPVLNKKIGELPLTKKL